MASPTVTKRCTRCKEVRPASEFYANKETRDRLGIYCRECLRAVGRERTAARRRAKFDALVPLTHKGRAFVKLSGSGGWVTIDPEDFPKLYGWGYLHRIDSNDRSYAWAVKSVWNRPKGERGKRTLLHWIILGALPNPGEEIDHWDRNGLNNCKSNLRVCTRTQNNANRRRQSNATSTRFKGIYPHAQAKGRWCAQIGLNGKRRYLGIFATEEEAARAYDAAARETFGEFARTNFPCPASSTSSTAS